jgi:hypothetical protein
MFQLIAERGDSAEIEKTMLEEFDVEPATLRTDLARFLTDLLERQLVMEDDSFPE